MTSKPITIMFPHQLFPYHPAIKNNRKIFSIEESLFFNQYKFHEQKLTQHRASMQFYYDWLKERNFDVLLC